MVWVSDEMTVDAIITGSITNGKKRCTIQLSPSKEVESIFSEAARDFQCQSEEINFVLQINDNLVFLDNYRDKRLNDIGVVLEPNSRPVLVGSVNIRNKTIVAGDSSTSEDALALGASASPTSGCGMNVNSDSCSDIFCYTSDDDFQQWRTLGQSKTNQSTMKPYVKDTDVPLLELPCNYVGLVNQAMTCYLNSLLQALYMTPEFRNALYNWEFDGQNETRSIPFQLQKLFLNLQTSSKSAVETTDLTTSFGWQGSEAWHQHDIQELCRVMFDALEQKFKDTKQANLINDLYEGKMLDYVKCLECGTEKSREDAFLDIPLPVRPFGSIVAYNSVEEALRAFVQYETLEGSNQYYCEKCNKKCDAHKGLKFIKFPYLLTLHLKRFDFDYNTMLRIKLNDKVVFPAVLNLNYFIPVTNLENEVSEDRETVVKCDDCSTTDSGSALDDESCHGTDTSCTVNGQDVNSQDEDEGIDMGMGGQENEKNRNHEPKGPYVYELFSIMIHSGSASGGHYYAYIKDFQSNMWYCFNDQSVSRITEDDIKKTYGGSSTRSHYSGAYSTNAYMLMYRQIDKERNCLPMSVEDFPPHIKKLLKDMKEKEESDRINKEKENDMVTLRVYCYHPIKNRLVDVKVVTFIDSDLQEAVKDVYDRLKLDGVVKLEDCRLVSYNKSIDCIECSFDDELIKFCDLGRKLNLVSNDWLLEIKKPGTQFKVHKRGGVKMKVYMVNLDTEDLDGPVILRVNPEETVGEFKQVLADMLDLVASTVKLAQEMLNNPPQYLDDDSEPLKFDPNFPNCYKMYVTTALLDNDPDKECLFSNQFLKVVERFANVICLNVTLPETDIVTLENLSIPPLDLNQNLDKTDMGAGDRLTNSPNLTVSPRPGSTGCMEGFGDQSNSEDSSLSDSDRTLVGDAPGDCLALLSSSSDSPADQHMASPSDPAEDTYNHEIFSSSYGEMHWDNEEAQDISHNSSRCYFKAVPITTYSSEDVDTDAPRLYKVLLDKYMTLGRFKKHIEPIVGVPVEYFKFFRRYNSQDSDIEWTSLTDNFVTCKDGDCVMIKLGRVLKKDEFIGKVFLLAPNNSSEPFKFLFEHIFSKGQTVGSARKEIILQAKKQHMLDVPYNRSRLRKKCWKMAAKVLLDDQKFDDISVGSNFEVCLQELPGPEKVTSINQLVLFVRRWRPSTLTLDPVHEVVLDECLVSDLYRKISEESGIPVVNLEIAYQKNSFPCDINVLSVNELEWDPTVYSLRDCPFQVYDDGHIFLYRDSREELKELTPEERKEIQQRENSRLGVYNYRDNRLSRRERALVIHVDDNSPSKSNDTSGD